MDVVNGPPVLGSIMFLTGPAAGSSHSITKSSITIGRDPSNDIVVSDPSVSRQHVQISWNNGTWGIIKLSQQNVLTINQQEAQQGLLHDRDTIGLGTGTTFLFQVNNVMQKPAYPPFSTQPQQIPSVPQQSFPQAAAIYPHTPPQVAAPQPQMPSPVIPRQAAPPP